MSDSVAGVVRQWQRVLPDLDIGALVLTKRLVRLNQLLAEIKQEALAAFELDEGEYDVLATLLRSGQPYQLTPTELTRSLLGSSSGMTKRLDRLESRALISRGYDPQDRRSRLVRLTARGRQLTIDAVRAHTAAWAKAVDTLPTRKADALSGQLADWLTRLGG